LAFVILRLLKPCNEKDHQKGIKREILDNFILSTIGKGLHLNNYGTGNNTRWELIPE
jgi:hypothetical protein